MQRLTKLELLLPLCLLSAAIPAQDAAKRSAASRPAASRPSQKQTQEPGAPKIVQEQIPAILDYDKHKGLVVAKLDGRAIRLVEIVRYIGTHYDTGLEERLNIPREINSREFPKLVHQYILAQALRLEIKRQELAISLLPKRTDQFLAIEFEERNRPNYEKAHNRKLEGTTEKNLKLRHRRERGMAMELKALVDRLVPGIYKMSQVRQFHRDFGRYFGGKVKFAHVFFETRDRRNGRLYQGNRLRELRSRLATVQSSLRKDGSRFEELAGRYSDDAITAKKGGLVGYVKRLDERLPAELVKVAWELNNGEVSKPVESYYGIHLIRRISFVQHVFPLFTPKRVQEFADFMKKLEGEDLMLSLKKRHRIERFL